LIFGKGKLKLNRRKFFQTSALSALAIGSPILVKNIFASTNITQGLADKDDSRPIIIVGAGIAGLAAGRALHNVGRRVIILEARNRIGGRTFTTKIGPATVDLGGAWIHGDKGNPIAKFARANGLTYTQQVIDLETFYDGVGGGKLDIESLGKVYPTIESASKSLSSIYTKLDKSVSVADAIKFYLDNAKLMGAVRRRTQFALEMLTSASSAPLNKLSYLGLARESEGFDGGDHVIAGGYGKIVDLLAQSLEIRTGTPVSQLVYNSDGVRVMTVGKTIDASHAIVTVPLGVLKARTIKFSPELPKSKQIAIERLGVGFFEKVVMVFKKRYWQNTFSQTLSYLGGLGQNRKFPLFIDMSQYAGAPTLVCIYSGSFAQQVQKSMSKQELIRNTLDVLRTVIGSSFPEPIAASATNWTTDPFSRGAYSYFAVGSSSSDIRTLAEPVGNRLLFAGEATSVEFPQTVHGAFISGLREAKRIAPEASVSG